MELIYLWIDGYKNLNDFGTLLNGKYNAEKYFDSQNGNSIKIIIKNREAQYIFEQNLNIITIAGKNGTGKSNLCSALASIIRKNVNKERKITDWDYFDSTEPKKYCLIYKQNDKFKYVSQGINCEIKLFDGNTILQNNEKDLSGCALFLPYLNFNEDKVLEFPKYHINELINAVKTDNYFYYDRFRIYDTSHALRELFDITQKNNIELFEPYENYVFKYYGYEFNIEEEFQWLILQLEELDKWLNNKDGSNLIHKLIESNKQIVKLAKKDYFRDKQDLFKKYLLPQACFSYSIFLNPNVLIYANQKNIEMNFFNENLNLCRDPNLFIEIYNETINNIKNNKNISLYTIDLYVDTNIVFKKYITLETNILENKNEDFLDKLTTSDGNLFKLKNEYLVPINKAKEDVDYIKKLDELKVFRLNYYNEDDSKEDTYTFINLSSGEQRKLRFLADFISVLRNDINTLIIDEIDMSWHPEWQRKFIYYIVNIIKTLNIKNRLNIIITTHSPLILSDMPSENVILLERDNNGKTKVHTENIDTFCANIYDLFKNEFFLNSCSGICTIGEFAKSKIKEIQENIKELKKSYEKALSNKVINRQNSLNDEIKKYAQTEHIINKISEPIIRKSLLRELYKIYNIETKEDIINIIVENLELKRKLNNSGENKQ